MTRRHMIAPVAPALALLLAGCAGDNQWHPPIAPVAPAWHDANAAPRVVSEAWWQAWRDPALDALVTAALAANADIDGALARVEQARAMAGLAKANRLPEADINATVARSRQSIDSGLGRLVQYVPTLSRTQNQADLGLGASWDLDFAGSLRHEAAATRAELGGAEAGLAAARLAVAADVVDAYVALRGAERQLALLDDQRQHLVERRGLIAARVGAGDAAASAGDAATVDLATIEAALPDLAALVTLQRNRLAVLTGRPAGSVLPELGPELVGAGTVPDAPDPAAGTPADLLRARPDIRLAEAKLVAAHARIGEALAEYWPHVSLSGLIGFSSNDLSTLVSPGANVIQGAVGLRWRLFDFGRIDAQVRAARGGERAALAAYRGAVLQAGADVEAAFIALAANRHALAARQREAEAQAAALSRAEAAARAGQISRDSLIGAEVRALAAADAVIVA